MCLPFTHKWKTIDIHTMKIYGSSDTKALPIDMVRTYVLECEKCGDVKKKKVKL